MIFTEYGDKLFYIDIFLHLFFTLTLLMILFIVRFRKEKQKKLEDKIAKILNGNIMNELSTPTNTDKTNLNILDKVYENNDEQTATINDDIKKASYNQVIIFCIGLLIAFMIVGFDRKILNLVFDKFVSFMIIGSTLYLYCIYFRERITEIKEEKIYDILKRANKELKNTVTY
jgi:hypothetical protein